MYLDVYLVALSNKPQPADMIAYVIIWLTDFSIYIQLIVNDKQSFKK